MKITYNYSNRKCMYNYFDKLFIQIYQITKNNIKQFRVLIIMQFFVHLTGIDFNRLPSGTASSKY